MTPQRVKRKNLPLVRMMRNHFMRFLKTINILRQISQVVQYQYQNVVKRLNQLVKIEHT